LEYVHCEISEGPRTGFLSVGIDSVEGYKEYLAIEEQFLVTNGPDSFLAIAVVGKDITNNTTLIELPFEADSGAKRVWVPNEEVTSTPREVVA
jgi:hypothetical protein